MPIDSHCHIHFRAFNQDRNEVIERTRQKGWKMITVGTCLKTSESAVSLAAQYPSLIFATIGLHPVHLFSTYVDDQEGAGAGFTSREEQFDFSSYKRLAQNKNVVAIGETGLDFFHIEKAERRTEEIAKQKEVFKEHLRLAKDVQKPLVLHCRGAFKEMADILEKEELPQGGWRGVVHCYTGNWEQAQRFLALGFCIGFTGVITYKPKASEPGRQEALLEVVRHIPLDKILVETDAPYLAPVPYRGQRAEPWMAEEVIKKIAGMRSVTYYEVVAATEQNTKRIFGM